MVFGFGKKVVIEIRLRGEEVRSIKALVDEIYRYVLKNMIPRIQVKVNETDEQFPKLEAGAKMGEQLDNTKRIVTAAKNSADHLVKEVPLSFEEGFFEAIMQLIKNGKELRDFDYNLLKIPEFEGYTLRLHRLAQLMADLIQRILVCEIPFIHQLQMEMEYLAPSNR